MHTYVKVCSYVYVYTFRVCINYTKKWRQKEKDKERKMKNFSIETFLDLKTYFRKILKCYIKTKRNIA